MTNEKFAKSELTENI